MSRILQVYQPTGGGVARHVRDLTNGLSERGHEILLCGPALPDGMSQPPPGARHISLPMGRSISPRADLPALRRFAEIVRRQKPDLIHSHSSKAGALTRAARPAHPRVPVFYTPHGYAFAGSFSHESERLAYREIERLLAPLTSRVVCVCEAEARLAARVGPRRRIRVVHNGVGAAGEGPTDPRMVQLRRGGPLLCVLTQLRGGKGIETLIDAMSAIVARHPGAQAAIWGEGPERETLEGRARRMQVEQAVHFLGPTLEPLAVMRGTDILVHPSLAESFPYVILEAMSVGAPIVASDVGGVGEALLNGESGLLVTAGEVELLAAAVNRLLDDPEGRARMGKNARDRVEHDFTLEAMIDRLVAVYDEESA
jgi:glycosyltransferase involved in cell wall biosynthesis